MTKKHFLNEILSPKLLAIAWGFILVVCVFIGFSIRGKCATISNGLPYNVINDLPYDYSTFTELYNQTWSTYPVYWDNENVIAYYQDYVDENNFWVHFIAPKVENATYTLDLNGTSYDSFDVNNNYVTIRFTANEWEHITFRVRNGSLSAYGFLNTFNIGFLGTYAKPIFLNGGSFNWGDYPVIYVYSGDVVVNGHATPPDLTGDNIDSDKPDIDDYIPNVPTMPTLDNSSLEKIAESIYNILQWGFNALKGTLQGLFEYLGDLLSYSFQKVIDNIKNAIQNLYDNFVSLFEPVLNGIAEILDSISQKLDYISQPFDSEALQEAFENTAISDDIDSISQLNEQAFGTWSTTEEPNEFKIALHTEQIPLADNVNFTTTTQYIDLGVINGAKPYIRGVMWCLVTFSLLYTIIDSIPNYIGGNDE